MASSTKEPVKEAIPDPTPTPGSSGYRPHPPPPRPSKNLATAIFDFEAQQNGDLSFRKGDIITVINKTEKTDDWWYGRCNGREGQVIHVKGIKTKLRRQFPANYVELR